MHEGIDREGPAGDGPSQRVDLHFRPTIGDQIRLNAYLVRNGASSAAVAALGLAAGAYSLYSGDLVGLLWILFGLSLATGLIVVPLVWLTARRRADLLFAEIDVVADPTGLTMTTPVSTSRQTWAVYREVRETGHAFLLGSGTGRSVFILKRGADATQVNALRSLLEGAGIRRRGSRRRSQIVGIAAGIIAAAALGPGQALVQDLQTNASISLSPIVSGRAITIRGSTDLPDGSSIVVEIVQLDEYDRQTAAGVAPDAADSPWIETAYVTVTSGTFATSFNVPTWPAGRAGAEAFFWMQPGQPASAAARYGRDGASMAGPDVVQTSDRGRMLRVQSAFELP